MTIGENDSTRRPIQEAAAAEPVLIVDSVNNVRRFGVFPDLGSEQVEPMKELHGYDIVRAMRKSLATESPMSDMPADGTQSEFFVKDGVTPADVVDVIKQQLHPDEQ